MSWIELPFKLKLYIVSLSSLATPIAVWAIWKLSTTHYDNGWLILAALALFTIPFFVFLESASATMTIGDAYIMAIAMMYGVVPCLAATFCHTLLTSILASRPKIYAYRVIFNIASTTCVAWLYSSIFHHMIRGSIKKTDITDIILYAIVLFATYFIANSILVSIAISWYNNEKITQFWAKTCMHWAGDLSISAGAATGIAVWHNYNEYASFLVAPVFFVLWTFNKLNKSRLEETENHLREQKQLYLRTVESLAMAVDAKDQTTYGHIRRVRAYAIALAKLCGITDANELMAINTGSLLHDIGKLAIADYILNKPGRLSEEEFKKIKTHTVAGDEILQQVRFPFPVTKYVRSHHERWDGNGYPDGLKGEEIPLGARILAVADAFDAIRFSRPYKLSMATDEALDILRSQSGIYFDPILVQLFVNHIDELEQSAIEASQNAPELSFRKYFETADRALSVVPAHPPIRQDMPSELVQFAELCSAISGYLDLPDILQIFSRRMSRLVSYNTCVFYLSNDAGGLSAVYACGKHSDILQGHRLETGMGISGWVAAYGRPMMNTEPALDFLGINGDFSSFTDALVVPLVHGNTCYGAISLYAQEPISYSRNDLSTLQALGSLLAPLISESKKNIVAVTEGFVDSATQLHKTPYLTAIGPGLISFAEKHRTPLSLFYLEIKNFGQIIRLFGGIQGNALLRKIAEGIKPELRETDILIRYGHHGFIALLPGVRNDQAFHCVQRLKQQIRNEAMSAAGQGFSIDCRAGVSSYPKDGATVIALLQSAQENMQSDLPATGVADKKIIEFSPRT
jgi:diguanylate cyclase (GGDEF)-like protein/putative nucleotidyltransferase with HDIG domain